MDHPTVILKFGFGIALIKFPEKTNQEKMDSVMLSSTDFCESVLDDEIPGRVYVLENSGNIPTIYEKRMSQGEEYQEMILVLSSKGSQKHKERLEDLENYFKNI